jgi:glutathione synthase/RimK-type ligase-like ATP-grasp enzyme
VPRLANAAAVLRWNTDKRYLVSLAERGIPVVPTTYVEGRFEPPAGDFVVKPTVSAAAADTARYGPDSLDVAAAHVARLQAAGRGVMLQPYLHAVEAAGETSLLFLDGEYSHGARKGAVLANGVPISPEQYDVAPREPSSAERALADRVVGAVGEPLLYARVDLLAGPDGPVLLELELTEPFLFLGMVEGAADGLAAAIARRAGSSST